jgi:ribonuclease HII
VCGIDEAGRGPWAGPVFAAAVIFKPNVFPDGLNDSKQLSAARRNDLATKIRDEALAWSIASASAEEIDRINILKATGLAMQRCLDQLSLTPAWALVDGSYRFALSCPVLPVVKGDGRSVSIAAASILAKTARDRLMHELDDVYPGYGFGRHKGYGVREHAAALSTLGPCPEHRMSYKPLRDLAWTSSIANI